MVGKKMLYIQQKLMLLILIITVVFSHPNYVESIDAENVPDQVPSPAPPVTKYVAVADDYFNDAVFIGDSRTEGFKMLSGPLNAVYLTSIGLKVDTVAVEALSEVPFKKVFIMLGINELGWVYSELFIEKYGELIDNIKKIEPQAQIYIQSILPVSRERSESDSIYNNENINKYNELIQQMAVNKNIFYLNVAECVTDEEGYLYSDASTDGIHLNKKYCDQWFEYIKTHVVFEQ
ncbi:MAG: GDSL-type esterase/lipase family protein [Eubacteriales bacterium]|nr:GDSL-type esterase/lipase family protein [Eubacteriales bacterium]